MTFLKVNYIIQAQTPPEDNQFKRLNSYDYTRIKNQLQELRRDFLGEPRV